MQNEITKDSPIAKQANKLIESVYRMDANEQKIILLATKIVNNLAMKGEPFDANTEIVITADQFIKEFGVVKSTAFEALTEAKNKIYERSFEMEYKDANGVVKQASSRWIHRKAEVKSKSAISIFFSPAVIPCIYFVVSDFYTLMDLREIANLNSKYAIRLYKLLMKWRNADYQPKFTYEKLREKLGLEEHEYPMKSDFRKRVIDVATGQINNGTGFVNLRYEVEKAGKVITHFKFIYDSYDNETINVTHTSSKKGKNSGELKNTGKDTPDVKKGSSAANSANDDEYTNHCLLTGQAVMFAKKIVAKIMQQDSRFMHLASLADEGMDSKSFENKIIIDLEAGDIMPYASALRILNYKQHRASFN